MKISTKNELLRLSMSKWFSWWLTTYLVLVFICYFSHFLHLLEKNHIKESNTSCLHEHNYKFNQTKPNLDMRFLCRLDNPIQKKSCQNKISHHCVCGLLFIVNLISSRIHRMNVTFYVSVPNAIFLQAPEFNG